MSHLSAQQGAHAARMTTKAGREAYIAERLALAEFYQAKGRKAEAQAYRDEAAKAAAGGVDE